jgi:basic amino acid/polyamine antiporter, APA family
LTHQLVINNSLKPLPRLNLYLLTQEVYCIGAKTVVNQTSPPQLQRQIGVKGAVLMGLGSIVGTGVFISIGIAAGIAGSGVVLAVAIAALIATANGLNSAQLASSHPVSGGTYEYGYKYLNPWLGFTAGWMFLVAKTASAATAALGFAGYLTNALGIEPSWNVAIALLCVITLTLVVWGGIQRSNLVNIAIVSLALFSLIFFILGALPKITLQNFTPFFPAQQSLPSLLQATALMFVAYTGYGRIATLGEEVKEPRKTIPQAIAVTMLLTMGLYMGVAIAAIGAVGALNLAQGVGTNVAPLEVVARSFNIPGSSQIVALGAICAMLGVVLNLVLGLSRVVLAMARRRDLPRFFAKLNPQGTNPTTAVILVGIAIACLVLIGNVKTTWSFSAFTVLIYYGITNLAALQLPSSERLYPKWLAVLGLLACFFLAFWVETQIWLTGIALIVAGLIWHFYRSSVRQ